MKLPHAFVWAFAVAGCDAATGGREVRYELEVRSAAPSRFQTSTGWEVTLEQACVSIGPVYVYSGEATAAFVPRLYEWLVPTAHAHPGVDHFAGGEARGEWLSTFAVDALQPSPRRVGLLEGPAGVARTVSLNLTPPLPTASGDVACLRGHQAYVVGVARREGVTVAFEGGLDIENTGNRRRIQVPVDLQVDDGIRLRLVIDPRPWLDGARFEELTASPDHSRLQITADSQVRAAWFLGVQRAGAFAVEREP